MDKLEKAKKERTKVSDGQVSWMQGECLGFVGPAGGAPRAPGCSPALPLPQFVAWWCSEP